MFRRFFRWLFRLDSTERPAPLDLGTQLVEVWLLGRDGTCLCQLDVVACTAHAIEAAQRFDRSLRARRHCYGLLSPEGELLATLEVLPDGYCRQVRLPAVA